MKLAWPYAAFLFSSALSRPLLAQTQTRTLTDTVTIVPDGVVDGIDRLPVFKKAGKLEIPKGLENVNGMVELMFIVDSTGHVDSSSIRVVAASDSAFVPAAREYMLTSRFTPGKKRGRAVRVLVRQSITFSCRMLLATSLLPARCR